MENNEVNDPFKKKMDEYKNALEERMNGKVVEGSKFSWGAVVLFGAIAWAILGIVKSVSYFFD